MAEKKTIDLSALPFQESVNVLMLAAAKVGVDKVLIGINYKTDKLEYIRIPDENGIVDKLNKLIATFPEMRILVENAKQKTRDENYKQEGFGVAGAAAVRASE